MSGLRRSSRLSSRDEAESDLPPAKKTKTANSSGGEESQELEESKELEVGDPIPDLSLDNQDNEEISLKKVMNENKIVVIFGYPKANTPGCTRQACGFRDNYEELKDHAVIFGVSADNVGAQKKFQEKQDLPFDLLSDPERHLIGLLGAKKSPQSGIIRSYWIFADGVLKIKRVKVSPEVSINDAKKEVMELAELFEAGEDKETEQEKGNQDKETEEEKGNNDKETEEQKDNQVEKNNEKDKDNEEEKDKDNEEEKKDEHGKETDEEQGDEENTGTGHGKEEEHDD